MASTRITIVLDVQHEPEMVPQVLVVAVAADWECGAGGNAKGGG